MLNVLQQKTESSHTYLYSETRLNQTPEESKTVINLNINISFGNVACCILDNDMNLGSLWDLFF
jgi:hypothetical protein